MTANTLEERRRYVDQVKASFQNPSDSKRYRDVGTPMKAAEEMDVFSGSGSAWKWRLVVALLLFGGFIYLSQNQITVGGVTAAQVASYLEQDLEWEGILNELPVDSSADSGI